MARQLAGFGLVFIACAATGATPPSDASVRNALTAMTVPFVANAGQWDREAAFGARTFVGALFVTTTGKLVYSLPGESARNARERESIHRSGREERRDRRSIGLVLTETLVDAHHRPVTATPSGSDAQPGSVSFAIGSDARLHVDNAAAFERVDLGNVYPGIAMQLRATGSNVEKIFTVAAGRDPSAIRIRVGGTERLSIGADGELVAETVHGNVTYTAPIAYQDDEDGNRRAISARYVLASHANYYGFAVGTYDSTRPLVIDPFIRSTFLGGTNEDFIAAMAIHPVSGEVYVAGSTKSAGFPRITDGAFTPPEQPAISTGSDVFVTRLTASLDQRLQSIYIGGDDDENANAIAIHPSTGDVYVAGNTSSTNFPKAAGGLQPTRAVPRVNGSVLDGFIVRLDAALSTRKQSTYLGGNDFDMVTALAIHPQTGDVYAAGYTLSGNFPIKAGALANQGKFDAFVSRVAPDLKSQQSSLLGGIADDYAQAIAIHPVTGDVYIAGHSSSGAMTGTAGAAYAASSGLEDAFVGRFSPALDLVRSTFVGGIDYDFARAIAIHPVNGDVYIAGWTNGSAFPKTTGGAVPSIAGSGGFVARLSANLAALVQSSYVTSGFNETVNSMTIHPVTGDVFAGASTQTNALPPPYSAGGAQAASGGVRDGFVARFRADLASVYQATFIGGTGSDEITATVLHPSNGNIYVAGLTTSPTLPSIGGEQVSQAGLRDGFVSAMTPDLTAIDAIPNPFAFAPKLNVPVGSLQTSGPAAITGLSAGNIPISLTGGSFAQYCITTATCSPCTVQVFGNAPATINEGQMVCVRQLAPNIAPASANTTLIVGAGWASFHVTTGTELSACTLDVDGNGVIDALTDGLMLLRAMFGLTGTSVTNNAVGTNPQRNTWSLVRAYLNGSCGTAFGL